MLEGISMLVELFLMIVGGCAGDVNNGVEFIGGGECCSLRLQCR